jgi:integrase
MGTGVVMDDGLVDAAQRVLFACVGVRRQEHPELRQLGEFLYRYSLTEMSSGGEAGRCAAENRPFFEYAPGRARIRNNGVESYESHDNYEDAVLRAAGGLARARIDLELLHKAVPASWVPIVAALIADGPDTAAARAHAAIYDYSRESVKANRRRAAGTRSRSTVLLVLAEARRLLSTIHNLRTLPACRQWVQAPQLRMPDMPKGGYEVVAPRVETVRQAWQDKSSEIHERLSIRSIEKEIEALNALSDNAVCCRGLWRPTRDRAILVLMVLTGGRRTALARLTRKDYVRDCEGPLPDCRRGAALDLLPRKSKGRDEVRRKPIPAQAALVLDFYLEVMDRMAAAKGRPPASPDAPLLVAEPAQLKAIQEMWLYRRIAGSRKHKPLVPRDRRHTAEHTTDAKRTCGYTPHEYRHFANKLAERAGEIWNERHPVTAAKSILRSRTTRRRCSITAASRTICERCTAIDAHPRCLRSCRAEPPRSGGRSLRPTPGKRPDCQANEREMIRLRRIEDKERRLERDAQNLQARHASCGQHRRFSLHHQFRAIVWTAS